MAKSDDKTLAILSHILGIFTWFIGPLIIYLATDDKKAKQHSRNALNWQITLTIYMVISFVLIIILVGILFVIALSIMNLVFSIIAAVKANNDELWEYPMTINFVK